MVKKSIKFLWMICSCFVLLFVLPMTVKAGEAVTGGASCEEATEVLFGVEYTTTSSNGWFKVYTPENLLYLGAGYDEFTSIDAYDANKERIYRSSTSNAVGTVPTSIKLGEQTVYWDSHYYGHGDFDLEGNSYYYFKITTSKAEQCNFKLVYGAYPTSKNRKVMQIKQEYTDIFHLASTFHPSRELEWGFYSSFYQFTAPNTDKYKVILSSTNGKAKCRVLYKDGTGITVIDCEKNSTSEEIISVTQGLTYYVEVWADKIDDNTTEPVQTTFQVSNAKVSNIALNSNSLTMNKGDQFVLAASVTPENAVDKTITYTSSNPAIATISEEGVVTAVRGGNATITASANDGSGVQAMCSVTVIPKLVNRLEINDEHIEEDLGTFDDELYYYQLKATVYPTDADDTSVTYTSSNRSVVTVDKQSGVLKLKKPGTAIITCKTNDGSNLTKTCKVVLKQSHFKGYRKTIDKIKYKVTSDSTEGGTVVVYGVSNKNMKSYTINNSIIIDGFSYKITGIHDRAFKNCKKATNIVLGTQIKTIGKEAFYNCKKLKSLTIKSKKIKTVGKNAYKNINGKATIKVPSSKLSKYKKLMKDKGQKKSVKIKKM